MSDLDKAAFAAAFEAYQETDCSGPGEPCNAGACPCLATMLRAYISHVAASPADLRTVLAFDAGLAEGRRKGLEEAAKVAEWAHMVPPDDGSASEAECAVADEAARRIRALITKESTT